MGPWEAIRGLRSEGLGARVIRGGLGVGSIGLAETFLGLATAILLARELGLAGLGIYAIVFAVVTLGSLVAEFGMPILAMREIARAKARGAAGEIKGMVRFGLLTMGLVCLVAGSAAFLVVTAFGVEVSPQVAAGLRFGWALIPLVAVNKYISGILMGHHLLVSARLPEGLVRPLTFLTLLLGAGWWLDAPLSPETAILFQAAAAGTSLAASLYLLRSRVKPVPDAPVVYKMREWLVSGAFFGMSNGLRIVQPQILILLMSALSTVDAVGALRLAQRASGLAGFGSAAVSMTVGPHIASLHAEGDTARLQRLMTAAARIMAAIMGAGFLLFTLTGVWLIDVILGPEFGPTFVPILVMLGALVIAALFGPNGMLLNMAGAERDVTAGNVLAIGLSTGAIFVLAPSLSAVGGAWAAFAGMSAESIYLFYRVRARLRIRASAFGL